MTQCNYLIMQIAYCKTPLGWAEITAQNNAITSIQLVDQPRAGSIAHEHTEDGGVISQCIQELHEYFAGKRSVFSVKLLRQGTPFQKKVWEALEKIPYGKTCSYEDIAVAVGNRKAVRAVGLANGKNPHWVVVPCHRVIGKNKKLVGYAGGLDRKKWLLDHEKSLS